jgi:TM2 domain-containing membrane protein YozV
MIGRRLISGLAGAWTVTSPVATQGRLASVAGSSQRFAASVTAALLGRTEFPGIGELAALRPATRVLIAGLSGLIILVILVSVAAVVSVEMSTITLPEWLGTPSSAPAGTAARPPANFENIVRRPLFSRSRQGMSQASVSMPVQPPPPSTLDQDITLRGVFMSGPLAKAFLLSSQSPLGAWVQVDEEVAGWRVMAVQRDHVLLEGQGQRLIVQLNVGGGK